MLLSVIYFYINFTLKHIFINSSNEINACNMYASWNWIYSNKRKKNKKINLKKKIAIHGSRAAMCTATGSCSSSGGGDCLSLSATLMETSGDVEISLLSRDQQPSYKPLSSHEKGNLPGWKLLVFATCFMCVFM